MSGLIKSIFFFCFIILNGITWAQCPQILDGNNQPTATPQWTNCTGNGFTIFLQPTTTTGAYTIDWGDGTSSAGAGIVLPGFVSHTYAAGINYYSLIFTETDSGCTLNGLAVNEKPVNASIQIPVGGITMACAPATLQFINSSTNVSPATTFVWNFGDGSGNMSYNSSNGGDTLNHTYNKGTVTCDTRVTLTAENYCSFGNPTQAQYNPILIYDLDVAQITASQTLLCFPDDVVTFTNTTNKNCVPEGNTFQRYEYWNFGDHWGLGHDSIISWLPYDPPARAGHTLAFPGIGTYTIMMLDSNYCGIDTAYQTITITQPPTAGITSNKDTVCAGSSITITNTSAGGATNYYINYGAGAGWQALGTPTQNFTYNIAGDYIIRLVATISGGLGNCSDTSSVNLHVLARPTANFTINTPTGCDTLTTTFTNTSSVDAVTYTWTFGNSNTSNLAAPPSQFYGSNGTYVVSLSVENSNGCRHNRNRSFTVYKSPVANFTATSVCLGEVASFTNNSTALVSDPLTGYSWNFGNGQSSNLQNPTTTYNTAGNVQVYLLATTAHCWDTLYKTITVETKPTAAFSADKTTGCSPLTIAFTNNSISGNTYLWDFGDGTSSTSVSPNKTFTNTSINTVTYTVKLITSTTFGCKDTAQTTITLYGTPQAAFSSSAAPGCAPLPSTFTNQTLGATNYLWNFGDGNGSTSLSPTHLFQNTTLFIQNYSVSLIASNAQGCKDTASATVVAYPEPNFGFSSVPSSGCSPLTVSFPAVVGAVLYQWDFGDGSTSAGSSPVHTYQNTTTNDKQYVATLVATNSFNCKDTTTSSITVKPKPSANLSANLTAGCQPLSVNFTNSSTGGLSYSWDFGDGTTSASSSALVNHVFNHGNSSSVTYTVKLYVYTADSCSDTSSVNITVYPAVNADFTGASNGCSPLKTNYINLSTGASSFIWDLGNSSSSTLTNPSVTYQNNNNNTDTLLIRLIAQNLQLCRDTVFDTLLVYHKPQVNLFADKTSGCQPLTATLTQNTFGADLYSWNFGNGNFSTQDTTVQIITYTHNQSTPLTYNASIIAGTTQGCYDTASVNIIVNPLVQATFSGGSSGCSPLSINYQNQSTGATGYNWTLGNGSTSVSINNNVIYYNNNTYNDTITASLIAYNAYNCYDTAYKTFIVYHKPQTNFDTDLISGCQPLTINIQNNCSGTDFYNWSYGDGSSSPTNTNHNHIYTHNSASAVTNVLTLIGSTTEGCYDTTTKNILVYPQVYALVNSINNGCSPLKVNYQNQSTGALTYFWNFGNGSNSNQTNPSVVFYNNGINNDTINTQLIATNAYNCSDTANVSFLVYHKPQTSFTTDAISGCQPLTINIQDASIGLDSYNWSYGDGGSSAVSSGPHNHVYTHNSTAPVTSTLTLIGNTQEGCKDTTIQNITIYPQIHASISAVSNGCSPLKITFQNLSTGASTYNWNLGNGNNSANTNPTEIYYNQSLTNQTVATSLIAISSYNCADTAYTNFVVYHKPNASFNTSLAAGCQPLNTQFLNTSSGADYFNWNYGDGNTSADTALTHQHIYSHNSPSPQTQTISLITTTLDGCKDTSSKQISVYPKVNADFNYNPNGCSPLKLITQNLSTGSSTYTWSFGDGNSSTLADPVNVYYNNSTNNDTLPIQLISTSIYNCSDTTTKYIMVYHKPTSVFNLDKSQGCQPFTLTLTNQSSGGLYNNWSFGDGATITTDSLQITHTYTHNSTVPINETITLITSTSENCMDTSSRNITVYPVVTASFSNPPAQCSPVTAYFQNLSTGANTFNWTFGNGNSSVNMHPSTLFTNNSTEEDTIFNTLIATSSYGCQDTLTLPLILYHKPQAAISSSVLQGCQPLTTTFTNYSIGASSYFYDFGNGQTGNDTVQLQQQTYVHNATSPQHVTCTLIATTNNNCKDTASLNLTVFPKIKAAFTGTLNGCSPLKVSYTNNSSGSNTYEWSLGNGVISNLPEPVQVYYNNQNTDDTITIQLIATSLYGCSDTTLNSFIVYHKPNASLLSTSTAGCQPLQTQFINLSTGDSIAYWDFGNGITQNSTIDTLSYAYTHNNTIPINYPVKLIAETNKACRDTTQSSILVYPKVIAQFTNTAEGCEPVKAVMNNLTQGASYYNWSFGDGSGDNIHSPEHTYINGGVIDTTYSIQLIATSNYGCSDTSTGQLLVHPTPIANFIATPYSQVYPNVSVSYQNTSNNGNWNYQWSLGDGTTSNQTTPPNHDYPTWGDYTVTLTASTTFCQDTASKWVKIIPPVPIARFSGSKKGCSPVTLTFNNQSLYGSTYKWEFGDGNSSTATSPEYTYSTPGTYTIKLTVTGPGGTAVALKVDSVEVYQMPIASFSLEPQLVYIPNEKTVFFNLSNNSDTYQWDFGDGKNSNELNPEHTYLQAGQYTVTLIATTVNGCVDTALKVNAVQALEKGEMRVPNAFTPNINGSNGGLITNGAFDNDVFHPLLIGVIEYRMSIFNRWGELIFETTDPTIGWDGYYRGELCKQDVYVYKIEAKYINGKKEIKAGDVTLLR